LREQRAKMAPQGGEGDGGGSSGEGSGGEAVSAVSVRRLSHAEKAKKPYL